MDKENALIERPDGFENRLFFQARNLAIETLLLRLELKLVRAGFSNIEVHWKESSNISPCIELRFLNANTKATWEYGTCRIHIERDHIHVFDSNAVSKCFYRLKDVTSTEYWRGRQPKRLVEFREFVQTWANEGYFNDKIDALNYPFNRPFHSGF